MVYFNGYDRVAADDAAQRDNERGRSPDKTPVDTVIDQLDRRIVSPTDRGRLRDAVDRADEPQKGRAGADEGLGRATGRAR